MRAAISASVTALRAALGAPLYRRYVAGNSVSLVGTWVQRTAVGWLAWELSHSPAWVGAAAFADLFPTILTGPLGGVLADRHDRRVLILVCQTVLAAISFTLAILAWNGALDIYLLCALVGLSGAVIGINQPARLAFVPALVAREQLAAAVALNAVIFNGARFIGPAVAGIVIVFFGAGTAFALNGLSFLTFIAVMLTIRVKEMLENPSRSGVWPAMAEGLSYLARHPALGPLMLSFLLISILVRGLPELLPALVAQIFEGGIESLAILSSSLGIGAVFGGLWLAGAPTEKLFGHVLTGMLVATLASLVVVMTGHLWIATAAMVTVGVFLVTIGVGAQTILQLQAPPELRGRVMSLFGLIFRGGPSVGALLLGLLAEGLGLVPVLVTAMIVFLVYWLFIWLRRNELDDALQRWSRGPAVDR